MKIILNGKSFDFSDQSKLAEKYSCYDLELVEPGFDETTQMFIFGGVDAILELPKKIELSILRTGILPVAKIFLDKNGKKKLLAYFD